jgi:hypothetical protein
VGGFESLTDTFERLQMGALRTTSGKSEPEKTNDWLQAIYNLVNTAVQKGQARIPPLVPGNP